MNRQLVFCNLAIGQMQNHHLTVANRFFSLITDEFNGGFQTDAQDRNSDQYVPLPDLPSGDAVVDQVQEFGGG